MTELPNPYQPPRVKSLGIKAEHVVDDDRRRFVPATRWARLGGALVDGIFGAAFQVALGVLVVLVKYQELAMPRVLLERDPQVSTANTLVATLIALVFQGALIARRGQSLGKIVMRTQIVRDDGTVADWYHAFVLRTLPVAGLMMGPTFMTTMGTPAASLKPLVSLFGLASMIDALMIFGSSVRCGHDRFAGTFVAKVDARQKRPSSASPRRKKRKPGKPLPAQA